MGSLTSDHLMRVKMLGAGQGTSIGQFDQRYSALEKKKSAL